MLLSWSIEDLQTLHDAVYWREILEATEDVRIISINELSGFDECWNDWLSCDNEYAIGDRKSMEAGAGKYMNLLAIALKRK
jgi:hypothetical protein